MSSPAAHIGPRVEDGKQARAPPQVIEGKYVCLQHFEPHHVGPLWLSIQGDEQLWDYMPDGPFATKEAFAAHMDGMSKSPVLYVYAIVDSRDSSSVLGHISLMNMVPAHRSNEVGHVLLSKKLQRSTAATEVFYLAIKTSFEHMHSRRVEWKTNSFNEGSKKAALRLGFTFEGVFRNHFIIKGRSRDTAWFSMVDAEWPARRAALEGWLHPSNFDEQGSQVRSLSDIAASPP